MRSFTKKQKFAAAFAAATVAGSGTAYAYWTTTGTGTGTATAGNAVAVTITQADAPTDMVLDGPARDIKAVVANPASHGQATTVTATPSYPTSCPAANWTFESTPAFTAQIAAGQSTTVTVGTLRLNNLPTNQDGCKGAVVDFTFTGATSNS